ncbi:hypothetical protein [Komagataeibacter nataicola]|uniref:hypothetical protein n=1 Tax=Komagataeibacter nataicola TaxID=265960 RepID=UPI0014749C40|nr:hypothetical protein [Komagataeibacter nataicola]
MTQFIEYHDISTSSNVIVNKNQIKDIREKRTSGGGHDHYEITFINGTTVKVRMIGTETSREHFLYELNR